MSSTLNYYHKEDLSDKLVSVLSTIRDSLIDNDYFLVSVNIPTQEIIIQGFTSLHYYSVRDLGTFFCTEDIHIDVTDSWYDDVNGETHTIYELRLIGVSKSRLASVL